MLNRRSLIVALLALGSAEVAFGARKCTDVLGFEKEQIRNTVINNEFRITRTLTQEVADLDPKGEISYETLAGPGLMDVLRQKASAGGTWMDIGIGEGNAMREALSRADLAGLKLHGVAPYSPLHVIDRWATLQNRYAGRVVIEEKVLEEVAKNVQGKIAVATDIYGALSYVPEFDVALKQVLESLEPEGEFFFVLQKFVMNEDLITRIRDQADHPVTMEAFLGRIQGIELVSSQVTADRSKAFRVRRTSGPIVVPELKLKDLDGDKTPPRRMYQIAPAP